nr:MAG TPA: hypothetical protein [Caudoviricetes sp.]
MKVRLDNEGFVAEFVLVGDNPACTVPVDKPNGFSFMNYKAYRHENGKLILDADKLSSLELSEKQDEIRIRRERECYSVINRGQLWYEGVSISRLVELRQWYRAWLDAPATMVIPERPSWLD